MSQLSCYRESSRIVTSFSPELLEDVMTSSFLSVVSEESEDQFSGSGMTRSEVSCHSCYTSCHYKLSLRGPLVDWPPGAGS